MIENKDIIWDPERISFSGSDFKRAVAKIAPVAGIDYSPISGGMRLRTMENFLELTTTDGVRIAKTKLAIAGREPNQWTTIINAHNLLKATQLLYPGNRKSEAIIKINSQRIALSTENVTDPRIIIPSLNTGGVKYPDVESIFPTKVNFTVYLGTKVLSEMLGPQGKSENDYIFLADEHNGEGINVLAYKDYSKKEMRLGKLTANLTLNNPLPFSVAIRTAQLNQIVRANSDANFLSLELMDAKHALVFKSDADEEYMCLVMPLTPR